MVERVGHKLLGRASIHRTGQTKLEMTIRVEAERERRLSLGSWRRPRARRAARSGSRLASGGLNDRLRNDCYRRQCFFCLRRIEFGGLVKLFLLDIVRTAEAVDDFGVLLVNR